MNHSFIITQKIQCFDQVSNYKIAILQKIRRFQGRFKCQFLFSTEYVILMQKNGRKNLVSNYKITMIFKLRKLLAQFNFLSLGNDRIRQIMKKKKKKQKKLCRSIKVL